MTHGNALVRAAVAHGLRRWATAGGALGGLAVLGLRRGVEFVDFGPNAPPDSPMAWHWLDLLALLCPAPMLWSAGGGSGFDPFSWGHVAVAVLANAALYAVLAAMVWLGLARSKALLLAPALLVLIVGYAIWPA